MSAEVHYKDVVVPAVLDGLISHMDGVEGYREELRTLGGQWDLLTILGQMSGTGMDMSETRAGFQRLTSELLGQLGLEILNKTIRDLTGKAQVTVDIVIRNLFERTADIGFLATDADIRTFLKSTPSEHQLIPYGEDHETDFPETNSLGKDQLITRFREYVAKYSVYFNIILLDPAGRVLVQLDENNPVEHSSDPLIQEALNTSEEYVEVYRHSDLQDDQEQSLIYAYRVTESNASGSKALGVLCLCFRFDNEMQGIFSHLRKEDDWSVLTLLDKEGKVIASSDTRQIPKGAEMKIELDREFRVIRYAGREYLAKTCATKGYQGFFGLGWYGQALIPIEHAFDNESASSLSNRIAEQVLEAVMQDSRLFSQKLRSIPVQADHIQDELERTVWNGNVRESDSQSKVLLWNISDAGARTKRVFEESIGNLHETVVSGLLGSVEFQANLAVDIMDRNLYERANDCRWWALTTDFRRILSQPLIQAEDAKTISAILAYINGLYTVYTNLFVYDTRGTVIAVSNPDEQSLVGSSLKESWVQQTLGLRNTQSYSVSGFSPTALYGDAHTYVYGAAIRSLENQNRCVGGIGIVFDSTPQFREMLDDSLLRTENGEVAEGCFGVFVDRDGIIISSTDERYPIGSSLPVEPSYFSIAAGTSRSGIVEIAGQYCAVGGRCSEGYREYKVDDGYHNDVISLIFMPLAQAVSDAGLKQQRRQISNSAANTRDSGDVVELATFFIGQQWLGVRSEKVREAIHAERIIHIPNSAKFILGKATYGDQLITVIDLRCQLNDAQSYEQRMTDQLIVVVETEDEPVGIVVDRLGQIPAVSVKRLEPVKIIQDCSNQYIECLVKPNDKSDQKRLLLIIDPDKLVHALISSADTIDAIV